jgi:hypothetical protein
MMRCDMPWSRPLSVTPIRMSDMTTTENKPALVTERGKGYIHVAAQNPYGRYDQDRVSATVYLTGQTLPVFPPYRLRSEEEAMRWIKSIIDGPSEAEIAWQKEQQRRKNERRIQIIRGPKVGPDWRLLARGVLADLEEAEATIDQLKRRIAELEN